MGESMKAVLLEATPKLARVMEHYPSVYRCFEVAYSAHKGQWRKFGDKSPYITHPMQVAEMLCPELDETPPKLIRDREFMICAALLHDVLEDTNWTAMELLDQEISAKVIELVCVLTKQPTESYTKYIVNLKRNPLAKEIKLCDIRHNLRTLPEKGSLRDKYELAYVYLQVKE